jgi:hypothetical protein
MQFAQQYSTKLGILLVGDMGFQSSVPSRLLGKENQGISVQGLQEVNLMNQENPEMNDPQISQCVKSQIKGENSKEIFSLSKNIRGTSRRLATWR